MNVIFNKKKETGDVNFDNIVYFAPDSRNTSFEHGNNMNISNEIILHFLFKLNYPKSGISFEFAACLNLD